MADFAQPPLTSEEIGKALAKPVSRRFSLMQPLLAGIHTLSPVEALRLLLSALPDGAAEPHHILAVASVPVFAAAIVRQSRGLAPVPPNPNCGHAEDFLRMLGDANPDEDKVKALDTYLVTVSDHGLNASTFTARVIASTKAGMFSSVVGGLCALKGPLHGGAPGPVLDMLDDIGDETRIESWLTAALDRGERLMGFGHRIYRVRDPRADVLKGAVSALKDGSAGLPLLARWRRQHFIFSRKGSRYVRSRPMWNSTRRLFSKRWVFRATASPMCLPQDAWPDGRRMFWSRTRRAGSFARNRAT